MRKRQREDFLPTLPALMIFSSDLPQLIDLKKWIQNCRFESTFREKKQTPKRIIARKYFFAMDIALLQKNCPGNLIFLRKIMLPLMHRESLHANAV
jgi:hypothetical protein